jgi:hypothetical protein
MDAVRVGLYCVLAGVAFDGALPPVEFVFVGRRLGGWTACGVDFGFGCDVARASDFEASAGVRF